MIIVKRGNGILRSLGSTRESHWTNRQIRLAQREFHLLIVIAFTENMSSRNKNDIRASMQNIEVQYAKVVRLAEKLMAASYISE